MPAPLRHLISILALVIVPAAVHAQTGSISGRVTNALTGAPIAGIEVAAYNVESFQSFGVGMTDATGAYTITGLVPGRHAVFSLAENDPTFPYLDEFFDNIPCVNRNNCDFPEAIDSTLVSVTEGSVTANINFALDPLGRVTGTVTNAATGALLANITVNAYIRLGNSASFIESATTNATGVYTLSRLPAGQVYLFTTNGQGFVNEIYNNITCIGGCNSNTAINSGMAVPVAAGQTTAARDFALDPGGAISGTITNAATGAPIANVNVQAAIRVSGGTTFISSANSNASGVYTVGGLPTGTYFLNTSGGGGGVMNELYNDILCPVSCGSILQSGEEIAVTAGQTTPGKNFAMEVGGAISGTVVNAGNAPLQNIQVTAVMRIGNSNFSRAATTNAAGQYTIAGLMTGTYFLYVSSVPSGQVVAEIFDNITCIGSCSANNAIATGAPIPVTQGSNTANRNFNLAYSGGITGAVTEASTGMPINDDISIELYAQVGANRNLLTTTGVDSNGRYSFSGLAPGTYFVAISSVFLHRGEAFDNIPCPSASCSSVIGSATPINVGVGTVVSGRDFALDRAEILFGKVMSSTTGQPLVGVTINLYKVGTGVFAGSVTTDYRGGFGFAQLTNGSYVMFTSNTQGYRNEIYNGITCATTCSPATALSSGTPIVVSGAGALTGELITGITFSLEPRTDAPAAPTNFRATAVGFTAQFSWTAPTPSTSGVPTSYVIEAGASRGGTLVTLPVPGSAGTSFSVPGAPPGAFYVRVRAVNAFGTSPPSNEVLLVISGAGVSPPDAPTNLVPAMSGATATFLTFTWSDAVTGGRPTSYLVEAGTQSGLADIATLPVNTRSFTFTGVPAGFYFLRVRGVNAGGVGPASAEFMLVVGGVSSPPPPPNFNSHTVNSGTVTLNWVAPPSGNPTSYLIEAGSAPGLADLATVNTGNTNVTASFSGVPPGTYYVRVRAVNAIGRSVVSNERTVIVP